MFFKKEISRIIRDSGWIL